MNNNPNPLKYHYETNIKLDYFVLGADIAILGWTVVNSDWLPAGQLYAWLISGFWLLITLSILSGILRQIYNGMAFGVNHQYLDAGEIASVVERAAIEGRIFVNQQTGEVSSNKEFKKFASPHRKKEKRGKKIYSELSKRAQFYGNTAILLLVAALFFLVIIKVSIL